MSIVSKYFLTICMMFVYVLTSSTMIFAADETIETIRLNFRSANDVIAVMEPLMEPEDKITGVGQFLILETASTRLNRIKMLINELDQPYKNLLIKLKIDSTDRRVTLEKENTDKLAIDSNIKLIRTHSRNYQPMIQEFQTMDDKWTVIQFGQSLPTTDTTIKVSSTVSTIETATKQKEILSGFRILPQVSGQRVNLVIDAIHQTTDQQDTRKTNIAKLKTTISGNLGEWIRLSRQYVERNNSEDAKVLRTSSRNTESLAMFVKVDLLPNK